MKPPEYDSSAPQHDAYHYSNTSLQGPALKLHFQKNNSPSVLCYLNNFFKIAINQSLVRRHELPKLPNLFVVNSFWQRGSGGHSSLEGAQWNRS